MKKKKRNARSCGQRKIRGRCARQQLVGHQTRGDRKHTHTPEYLLDYVLNAFALKRFSTMIGLDRPNWSAGTASIYAHPSEFKKKSQLPATATLWKNHYIDDKNASLASYVPVSRSHTQITRTLLLSIPPPPPLSRGNPGCFPYVYHANWRSPVCTVCFWCQYFRRNGFILHPPMSPAIYGSKICNNIGYVAQERSMSSCDWSGPVRRSFLRTVRESIRSVSNDASRHNAHCC